MSKMGRVQNVGLAVLAFCLSAGAEDFQLASLADPGLGGCASAGGDSYLPVMTPDGRFVLFASTAANLVQTGTNEPIPAVIPAPLNVFLRDRLKGRTILISSSADGLGGGNADSLPVGVSTNGRFALFESTASNLVSGDTNNASDVFVRDVLAGTTLLISAGTNGGPGDDASYNSALTPDGRYVAFASAADNLVAGDTNGIPDVFVRDLVSNVTELISVGAQNQPSASADIGSDSPLITPDGRYVVFYSTALNVVPGVNTFGNLYQRDLRAETTTWASSGALAALQSVTFVTNAISFSPALSSDGRYVAYEVTQYVPWSPATTLVLRFDVQGGGTEVIETNAASISNGTFDGVQNLAMTPDGRFVAYVANALDTSGSTTAIRLWDGQTGTNLLVSADSTNGVAAGSLSDSPALDDTGRFVAFLSSAPDLVTNNLPGEYHLYRRDLQAGTMTLVDANTNLAGSVLDPGTTPAMSADGRLVAFDSQDPSLVPLDRNHAYDVFLRDVAMNSNELVSGHDPGLPCLTANGPSASSPVSMSFDARWIGFWSEADDLTPNDTNGLRDVYVRDTQTGTTLLISRNTNGVAADGLSTDPAVSADGTHLAFASAADDLVGGDTNQAQDVFVVALPQGNSSLVSVNAAGTGPGNGASFSPTISSNGQFVLFHSLAGNLAAGGRTGTENLFWRDLQAGSTYALTSNGVTSASMTGDGRFVAFITASLFNRFSPVSDRLYVWDSHSASISYAQSGAGFQTVNLSPDGQRIAYTTNTNAGWQQLSVIDRALGTNWIIDTYRSSSVPAPKFSADGRFLVYVAANGLSPAINQVYLCDLQTQTNLLVSAAYDGSGPGNDNSDSADISPDGRLICYRSAADNLVPADNNGQPDVFLYDSLHGITTLLSSSRLGGGSANNRSLAPAFSADGRTLLFVSWASDVVSGDFNNASDVFTFDLSGQSVPAFGLTILPPTSASPGNWLTWPALPGKSYQVQFKTNLNDPAWLPLSGPITVLGSQASFKDAPANHTRFYRIVASQ